MFGCNGCGFGTPNSLVAAQFVWGQSPCDSPPLYTKAFRTRVEV